MVSRYALRLRDAIVAGSVLVIGTLAADTSLARQIGVRESGQSLFFDIFGGGEVDPAPDDQDSPGGGGSGGSPPGPPARVKRKICVLKLIAQKAVLVDSVVLKVVSLVQAMQGAPASEQDAFPPIFRVRYHPPFTCSDVTTLFSGLGLYFLEVESEFTETVDLSEDGQEVQDPPPFEIVPIYEPVPEPMPVLIY